MLGILAHTFGPKYFTECFPYVTVLNLGKIKSAFLRLWLQVFLKGAEQNYREQKLHSMTNLFLLATRGAINAAITLIVVNRGEWLLNPDKVLCCRLLIAFLALTVKKHNSCLLRTEDLTNRNVLVTSLMHSV